MSLQTERNGSGSGYSKMIFFVTFMVAFLASLLNLLLDGGSGYVSLSRPTNFPIEVGLGMAVAKQSSAEIVSTWTAMAKDSAIEVVSVSLAEASGQANAVPSMDSWTASLNLHGSYSSVKRLMQQITARNPNVTWTAARWSRNPATGIASQQAALLDVQLQAVWLRRPFPPQSSALPASPH